MKKALTLTIIILILMLAGAFYLFRFIDWLELKIPQHEPAQTIELPEVSTEEAEKFTYALFSENEYISGFNDLDEAIEKAKELPRSIVKENGKSAILWDNLPNFHLFTTMTSYQEFDSFADAITYAKDYDRAFLYLRTTNGLIWDNQTKIDSSKRINGVPLILQNPELPRGCEVTALAMLLRFNGVKTNKMELADSIAKDPTPLSFKNGIIQYGNPNKGFVGSIDNVKLSGFGVYHGPVYDLAKTYCAGAIDLTGCDFENLLFFINMEHPVWLITNVNYAELPPSSFETWQTPEGEISITYREHAVVLTGFDQNNVYFNDPLGNKSQANLINFKKAWEQMGRQAITIVK